MNSTKHTSPGPHPITARNLYGYKASTTGLYRLSRDGEFITDGTEDELWKVLHRIQGQSVHHALTYEGYRIAPLG